MCSPQALILAGIGASTAGAYGQARWQQAAQKNNATLADYAAQDALERGEADVQQNQLQTAQLKGAQRAALAANGIDIGEGSAGNILTDTGYLGQRDITLIRSNAARQAWGYRTQALDYRNRARAMSPFGAALGTLLGSAGQVASRWR